MERSNKLKLLSKSLIVDTQIKPGVVFRSLSKVLAQYNLRKMLYDLLEEKIKELDVRIDYIAAQQSRGYWFIPLADRLKCGFVSLTKSPYSTNTVSVDYSKEYTKEGERDILYLDNETIEEGSNVLIIDDLIATGGTMKAAIDLLEMINCNVVGCACAIQLTGLPIKYSSSYPTVSVLEYDYRYEGSDIDNMLISEELTFVEEPCNRDIDTIVFYYPTSKHIAEKFLDNKSRLGYIKWSQFNDGTPDLKIENTDGLVNKDIIFVMDLSNLSFLFEQLSTIIVIQRKKIKSLNIHIPFFSVATMERATYDNEIATAEILSKIISSLCEIKVNIHVYDLHTLANRFYFNHDNCTVIMNSAIPQLQQMIKRETVIVFPDDGAYKRFSPLFKSYRQIILSKIRDGDERRISIKESKHIPKDFDKSKYDVLIVDDLVQSGSTLIEVINYLKTNGYSNISCYVTHGVFPNMSYKKFFNLNIVNFYVTDSIFQEHRFVRPFKLVNLFEPKELYTVNVAVTSLNKDKIIAAYNYISELNLNYDEDYSNLSITNKSIRHVNVNINMKGYNSKSLVSEQPVGPIETFTGAFNRILYIKDKITEDIIVSYENGITKMDDNCIDFNITILYDRNTDDYHIKCDEFFFFILKEHVEHLQYKFLIYIVHKPLCIIPNECYEECIERIKENKKLTIANVISETYGWDVNSWHEHFNEKELTRLQLLSL